MRRITRKILGIAIIILLITMVSASISPTFASAPTYNLITGKLGGADYVIYMPTNWNGRLVIGCVGYNYYQNPNPEYTMDDFAQWLTSLGYAYAGSNYNGGERAWIVKEGIIRTHQLTQYIIDNYHVTDKIFLSGGSMGGQIALNLVAKYPDLYSGVLDVSGSKGSYNQVQYANFWAEHSVSEIRALLGLPESALPDEAIAALKMFFIQVVSDINDANGGTIEEKPNAYDKYDTTQHAADINIPVISLVGGLDLIVPLSVQLEYQAAVSAAGHSDLYKLQVIPNGGHVDAPILSAMPTYLTELISWSDSLD